MQVAQIVATTVIIAKKKNRRLECCFFQFTCRKAGNEMLMTRIEVLIYVLTFKVEYTSVLDRKRIVETGILGELNFATYLKHGQNLK